MTKWLKLPSFGTDPLERWLPVRTSFDRLAYLFFSLAGSVLLVSAAVVGDFTQWLVPVNQSVLLAGATGAGAAILLLFVFRSPFLRQTGTPALLASALFWIVMTSTSLLRGYTLQSCLLLYGPVVAATMSMINRPIFLRLLFIILLGSILIQIQETISGQYLFVVESWGQALDETTTSGISGILRAKGLFAGPTVAAAFCILISPAVHSTCGRCGSYRLALGDPFRRRLFVRTHPVRGPRPAVPLHRGRSSLRDDRRLRRRKWIARRSLGAVDDLWPL
jgi:hypothetical protein